ncbi:MAG TPA: LLM class flavin-dependent oxidoreductase [Candidatus Dormibacteraeota bacterium]|nr:LLM class flavin-dependent oxidoreductase [Candidatus Dormibacteraeota bacterium]
MEIGVGIPTTVVGATGKQIRDWARRAEELGFSTLAAIGRVAYPTYDSLIALAVAGAVTTRIRLMTDILLGPTYDPVHLAKMAASVDQLTDGRMLLGTAVGGRKDDFELVGLPFEGRGKRWDASLELMHKAWKGEPIPPSPKPITPTPFDGEAVPMIFGGNSEPAIARAIKWGVGWTAGGGGPQAAAAGAEKVRTAWKSAGRGGEPRIVALTYYGVGPNARAQIDNYIIRGYYDYVGGWETQLAANTSADAAALKREAAAFADGGIDELIFFPTTAGLDQLEGLAEAVL